VAFVQGKSAAEPARFARVPLRLPGFVNAHTHTFQRRLRGCAETPEQGDFWAWRERMLEEAARQTSQTVRERYERAYREMRGAGYTAAGEFHYLGWEQALAAAEAGEAAGVELVVLYAAYARGGIPQFRQPSVAKYLSLVEALAGRGVRVGLAPHSVRACPADWLEEIGRYAEREGLVLHVHADEQPREVEECLAEHRVRPIELLERCGCLGPRTTVVHATEASDGELDLLAEAGSRVCLCPTTEANLGDGFAPVERLLERGIPFCIGSDSNIRIDPLEELREIEGIARRASGRRGVVPLDELLSAGADEGAAAVGLETWPDVDIDIDSPSLAGIEACDLLAAVVYGCSAETVVNS
jgi:formimidoylglutamate deiminase